MKPLQIEKNLRSGSVLKISALKILMLGTLGLFAFTLGCSQAAKFASVTEACVPSSGSARYGANAGPVIVSPTPDTPFNTNMPVSGTCANGYAVTISGDGIANSVTTACTNGEFSTTVQLTGADGTKQIYASQPTLNGQNVTDTLCVNRATVPPHVTINSGPGMNGSQAINTTVNTVSGSCESGLTVTLTGPNLAAPVTTTCSNGSYSASVTLTGADGVKDITATQTDLAGNTGNADGSFTIDTTPPTVTISAPTVGTLTNHPMAITGSCENGLKVVIQGTGEMGVQSVDCASGTYNAMLNFTAGDGAKPIAVSQTDLAGNTGHANTSVMLDTVAPAVAIKVPANNSYVGNTSTLTGVCENGENVTVAGSGITSSHSVACAAGAFTASVTYTAGDGAKQVTASQTDAAGNIGTDTKNYVKDTIVPAVTITAPAAMAYVPASSAITGDCKTGYNVVVGGSGTMAPATVMCTGGTYTANVAFSAGDGNKIVTATETDGGGLTGNATQTYVRDTTAPVVKITAPTAGSYVGVTANVTGTCENGENVIVAGSGVVAPTTIACAAGTFNTTVTFTAGDGSKLVTASETDAAGNMGTTNVTVIKDTTAPAVAITMPANNAYVAASSAIQGTCETGLNVVVAGTGVTAPQMVMCTGAAFSTNVTFTAGDGSKQVTATQTDLAGNVGTDTKTYIKDTIVPVVTITAPAAMAYVPASTNIVGTCESGYNVVVGGTGVMAPATVMCSGAAFTAMVTFTAGDGNKLVTATETDAGGLSGTTSRTYVRDTTAPVVAITAPAMNSYVSNTANVTGTCENGENVIVAGTGVTAPATIACSGGAFSTNITFTAGDGSKQITASETDAAGNTGTATVTAIKDTIVPVVTITSPAAMAYVPASTNIVGTCESGYNVVVGGTGVMAPATVMCSGAAFTAMVTFTAGDGNKLVTATETDAGGLTGTASQTYVRDTTAPVVTIVSPVANAYVGATPTIQGTCENGENVIVAGTGVTTPTSVACSGGAFTAVVTLTAGDGSKIVTASETDGAGNTGTTTKTYIKDTIAPVVMITSPASSAYVPATTNIMGTCESGYNVVVSGSGITSPSTVLCMAGAFTTPVTFTAGDGSKIVVATETDAGGLSGSDTKTYLRDTTAPIVKITGPAANTYTAGNITVNGTCETGLNVILAGNIMAPVTVACTAVGTFTGIVSLASPDGAKNVTATQTDLAGNVGTDNRTFNLLTVAPVVKITTPAAGTVAQNGVTVGGTCETGLNVVLAGSGASAPVTVMCTGGSFTSPIVFSAGDGIKNITATQTDLAGNMGSDNRNFAKDTTAPVVAITSPAANTATRNTITVTGNCETGLNVVLAGNVTAPVTVMCASATFSGVVTLAAPDGTKTVTATQTDLAGNIGSDSRNFQLLTAAPTVAITAPAANTSAQNGLTVSGTCSTGINVILAGTGASAPMTVACASGTFSGAIVFSAGDGVKNITATQTDMAGNVGSDNRNFVKDTTPPAVAITSPIANSYIGNTVNITGTCETGLNVVINGTGAASPAIKMCAVGAFSVTVNVTAGDGGKNFVASQTDAAGNVGSDNKTYIKDTTAPAVAITAPAVNTAAQMGLTVSGTCETGLNVVLAGTGVASPVTAACAAGVFSGAVTFTAGDGTKNVTATQTDLAGNVGTDNRNFVKDTTAPVITITGPASGTNAQTGVTLVGTCTAGLTINLSGTGLQSPSTATCATGTFSVAITFTAGDGNKNIVASQTDSAGNMGSDNRTFIKDTTAPVVAITSPAANTSTQNSLTVGGNCETGLNVVVGGTGVQSAVTTACAAGTFSAVVTLSTPDGAKVVTATQTDLAGNIGSSSRTFERDTTAPVVTITSPANNAYVTGTPTIAGNCESGLNVVLAGTGVQTSVTTACAGGNFSASVTLTAGDGAKQVTATETDLAGNVGTDMKNYVKDTIAPVVTFTAPANNSTQPQAVTVSGTCESGFNVVISGSVSPNVTAPCSAATFSAAINLANANGSNTITATETDGIGLTGTANLNLNVVPTANSASEVFSSKGPGGKVDILFSDDNSASMISDETTLASKFQNFAADLAGVDWQMGVVTTDCTAGSPYDFCGQLQPMVGASGGQYILTPSTPNYVTVFQNTIVRPEANSNCILTNNCASGNSQPLQTADVAMSLRNTNNAGFFRNGADLAVISLTNGHTGESMLPGYTPPAQFVTDFNSTFGSSGKRLAGYGIIIQPSDATCLAQERSGVGGATADYSPDIFDLASMTSGATVSICAPDYSITLSNIADSVRNLGNSYDLAHTPIPSSVNVTFSPASSTTWTVSGNVITFNPAPAAGTQITVNYNY